jgi:uncharacterized protein YndB with AHSA1/START domain
MGQLQFSVDIKAPKQKVWDIMLAAETYRQWTAAFHEGSSYEGSWDEGSMIRFVAEDENKLGGMLGKIAKNRPYEYLSIEYLGLVVDGQNDTTSEAAQKWTGSHENYSFSEVDGVTTLTVELESTGLSDEMADMFNGMWPAALAKLKEIVEKNQ